ncbi:MAG: hypothetical protein AAF353_15945 [Pseudomonadota bacterium]
MIHRLYHDTGLFHSLIQAVPSLYHLEHGLYHPEHPLVHPVPNVPAMIQILYHRDTGVPRLEHGLYHVIHGLYHPEQPGFHG